MLSITPNHLNDTIKGDTGKTAKEMIHERIILEIKRLMFHSAMSNKEIAYDLNFNDPAYFSRYVRKHLHCSPNDLRNKLREKYNY